MSRYFTACAASGLPSPTVTEEAGFFKVVFWRKPIDTNAKNGGTVFAKETLATNGKCEGKYEGMSEGKCESNDVKSSHDKIIEMLSCNPSLTREIIAAQMGLSVSRVEKVIRQLRTEGSLIREGPSRNGRWKIVK